VGRLNAKAGDKALELLPPSLLEVDSLLIAVKIAPKAPCASPLSMIVFSL
jgi:hypothetical protein